MMIELTQLQAMGYIGTIFFTGAAMGYRMGIINKTVTTVKTQCNKSMRGSLGISIEKIYVNGKCKDVNCMKLQDGKICSETKHKCQFL